MKIYFPQTNNGVFSFGRDVNILFKHGVNALSEGEQNGKGCVGVSSFFCLVFAYSVLNHPSLLHDILPVESASSCGGWQRR